MVIFSILLLQILNLPFCLGSEPGVYRSALQAPITSIDPIRAIDTNTQLVVNNSFDGLVEWTPEGGIRPAIASSWEISSDRLTYLFQIDSRAKFQDGSKVDARSVDRALTRLTSSKTYFASHYSNIARITVVDPNRVAFRLHHPDPHFLMLLGGVAAKIVKVKKDKIIGVGPFIPNIVSNSQVVLQRNDRYFREKPKVSEIRFSVMNDNAAISAAKKGLVDDLAIFELGEEHPVPKGWRVQKQMMWATWIIGFDQRVSPMQDEAVRKEIVQHLSSAEFVSRFYPGNVAAYGLIPFGLPGFLDPLIRKKPTNDGYLQPTKHVKVKFDLYIPNLLGNAAEIGRWIETSLANTWVEPNIRIVPFDWMIANYASGKMASYLLSINAEYPDVAFIVRALDSRSDSNFLGIGSAELDKLIRDGDRAAHPEARNAVYREVNSYLNIHAASKNLMYVRHRAWIGKCTYGLKLSPISEGYFDYREVIRKCA